MPNSSYCFGPALQVASKPSIYSLMQAVVVWRKYRSHSILFKKTGIVFDVSVAAMSKG